MYERVFHLNYRWIESNLIKDIADYRSLVI